MPGLTDDDKVKLSLEWRWAEIADSTIKSRHPGAREADRGTALVSESGANAVLTAIHSILSANNRLILVTCEGIIDLSFRKRPPLIKLYHNRFDLSLGREMICEGYEKRRSENRTILTLYG
jgi:hypothetical protein